MYGGVCFYKRLKTKRILSGKLVSNFKVVFYNDCVMCMRTRDQGYGFVSFFISNS